MTILLTDEEGRVIRAAYDDYELEKEALAILDNAQEKPDPLQALVDLTQELGLYGAASQQEPKLSQFLSDVLTAAGLVSHGKQSKALAERLSEGVMYFRAQPAPQQEPDWSSSETQVLECWKNPLHPMTDRLLMADGAVAFRDKTIANLRRRIKILDDGVLAHRKRIEELEKSYQMLLEALKDAAMSLRTIELNAGRDEYLTDLAEIRGYACSRGSVARAAIEKAEGVK